MIKNKNVKKIVICLIVALAITLVGTKVFASQSLLDALSKPSTSTEPIDESKADQIKEGTPEKTTESEPLDNQPEKESAEKPEEIKKETPTETPNLGLEDYSTQIVFICLFTISAIYGYKKIKEYNS